MIVWTPILVARMGSSRRMAARTARGAPCSRGTVRGRTRKGGRDRQHPFGSLLPSADREGADIGLEIETLVGIAERRQRLRQVELLLGDEILVLARLPAASATLGHVGDALRPQPGAVDEVCRNRPSHGSVVTPSTVRPSLRMPVTVGALLQLRAALAPRRGRRLARARTGTPHVAVGGNERRPDHALRIDIGEEIGGLPCGEEEQPTFEAEALGERHRAANFAPPVRRGCKPQRADLPPVDRLARLGFEPVEHRDRVLHQPREVLAAAKLANEASQRARREPLVICDFSSSRTSRSPRRAQGIGDRAADCSAADDDDARMAIERP